MARIFLAIVGIVYLYLAALCTFSPASSAKMIGLDLQPGSGQSEFVTVYGGLEFALAVAFLWPLYRAADTPYALGFCLLSHGCLVAFRGYSLLIYRGISPMTYQLAVADWVIFLLALVIYWRK
jgi:hypothetical protein